MKDKIRYAIFILCVLLFPGISPQLFAAQPTSAHGRTANSFLQRCSKQIGFIPPDGFIQLLGAGMLATAGASIAASRHHKIFWFKVSALCGLFALGSNLYKRWRLFWHRPFERIEWDKKLGAWCESFLKCDPISEEPRKEALSQILPPEIFTAAMQRVTKLHMLSLARHLVPEQRIPTWPLKPSNNLIYTKRVTYPQGTKLISFGDLHGDMQALSQNLLRLKEEGILDDNYKILDPQARLIFCGDFVDRGKYAVEVLFTLFMLKINNPEQVELVRGNHEDIEYEKPSSMSDDAFCKLAREGYDIAATDELFKYVAQFYGSLPSALCVRIKDEQARFSKHILYSHGVGIEPAYRLEQVLDSVRPIACHMLTRENFRRREKVYEKYKKENTSSVWQQDAQTINRSVKAETDRYDPTFVYSYLVSNMPSIRPHNTGFLWGEASGASRCTSYGFHLRWGNDLIGWHLSKYSIALNIFAHQHARDDSPISDALWTSGISVVRAETPLITHVTTPMDCYYAPFTSHVMIDTSAGIDPRRWDFWHKKFKGNGWMQEKFQPFINSSRP